MCPCCGEIMTTGGCMLCQAFRTYCMSCSTVLTCGCGRVTKHETCPGQTPVGEVIVIPSE